MSLAAIYEQIVGGATADEGQEKTAAAAEGVTENKEVSEESTSFGELVGEYFNEIVEPYFDKVAASLEAEAGKGEQPLAHAATGGSMTAALGTPKDPHLAQNHSASSGAALHVTTGGHSPYSLKEQALKKAILRRSTMEGQKVVD